MQDWNNDIKLQLNNLPALPRKQQWELGDWIEECHVRPEVADFASLPLTDNQVGDARISLADQAWFIWDGSAWQSMGGGGGGVNSVTALSPISSSGGVNPQISLTGTVDVLHGGTGLSSLTPGAVLFGNGTNPVGTDGGQLYWDKVNDRLGVGTGAPASTLSVGDTNQFRVDDNGNILRIHDVPYNWPTVPGGASTFLQNDGSGNLAWTTIAAGGVTSVAASSPLSVSGPAGTPTVNLTGVVPVANGGTGVSTVPAQGALPIGTGAGYSVTTLTAGSGVSITNAPGAITISATGGTGTVTSVGLSTTLSGITVGGSPVTGAGTLTLGGTLGIANGGTGQTTKTAAFNALSPTTTKGDLVVSDGTNNVRVPVGTNGTVLLADSTDAEGVVWGQVNLASAATVTGTLPIGRGGTGATSFTANTVLLGNGTSAFQTVAPGASGNVLRSNGTTWQSTALPAAPVTSVSGSGGTTGLTLTGGPTGVVTLTLGGTLAVANGGTGQSALTANNVLVGNGTGAVQLIAPGASGDVLTWNGTNWLSAPPTGGGGGVTAVTASAPVVSSGGAFPNISLTAGTNTNDVLTWNGSAWVSSPPSGGGVATVTASAPLASSGGANPDISLTGTVPVGNGGTGVTTTPTNGQLLIGNGTGYAVANLTAGTGISIVNGVGTVTINGNVGTVTDVTASAPLASSGGATPDISLTGIIPVANGGTGQNSLTLNNVVLGNGTSAVQTVAPGTSGNVLTSNGTTWQSTALPAAPVTSVSGSGGTTGLTLTGGPTGAVTLTLGGTLAVANGGTGQTSYTNGQLLIGNTTGNTLTKATLTGTARVTVTNGPGSITIDAPGALGGTVTSVGLSTSLSGLTVSGSPVTGSGTLSLGGTLGATSGGTGQTSYAVGDLLFANTTSTLAKLPDIATGNVLLSGGIGVAPSYGKVGLTTHVSGVLPVGNGGTGTSSTPTNGQLLIGNGTGFVLNTITGAGGISVTNGAGSITISGAGISTSPAGANTQLQFNNGGAFGASANLTFNTGVSPNTLTLTGSLTQTGGVFSLTGSAASTISTAAGSLTVQPSSTLFLRSTSAGIDIAPQTNGQAVTITAPNVSGNSSITLGAAASVTGNTGADLTTNGVGSINVTSSNGPVNITANGGATNLVGVGVRIRSNTVGSPVDVNSSAIDADLRVRGTTDANTLYVDASANSVGIGTNAPTTKLQVAGSFGQSGGGFLLEGNTTSGITTASGSSANIVVQPDGDLLLGTVNTNAVSIGRSAITTTITGGLTQNTGAFSLTGDAASQISTITGSLNITSAAKATWSSPAGVDIAASGGTLNISGSSLQLQAGATSRVDVNANLLDCDFRVSGDTDTNLLYTDASTDRVGVGTNAPTAKLTVNGSMTQSGGAFLLTGNAASTITTSTGLMTVSGDSVRISSINANLDLRTTFSTGSIVFFTDNAGTPTERMRVAPGGNVGINTGASPTQTLDINGTLRVRLLVAGTNAAPGRAATGEITALTSDQRLKKDIRLLDRALDLATQMRGVRFKWDKTLEPEMIIDADQVDKDQIGFIAQEVESVCPELVYYNGVKDYKAVRLPEITALLLEALKEMNAKVTALQAEVTALKGQG